MSLWYLTGSMSGVLVSLESLADCAMGTYVGTISSSLYSASSHMVYAVWCRKTLDVDWSKLTSRNLVSLPRSVIMYLAWRNVFSCMMPWQSKPIIYIYRRYIVSR